MNQEMLSIPDAAKRLSVTERTLYTFIDAGLLAKHGRPVRIGSGQVRKLVRARQKEAAQRRPDRAGFARQVVAQLHPEPPDPVYARAFEYAAFMQLEKGTRAVPRLHPDAHALWGTAALRTAAQAFPTDACKTCYVHLFAKVLGTPDPKDTEDWAVLLGNPCAKDRRRWADRAEYLAAVDRRGSEIQAQQAREQATAERAAVVAGAQERIRRDTAIVVAGTARKVTVRRSGAVTASSSRPAQPDDDGAALTASVLAKLERRRNAAVARGDQTSVATLNGQISRLRMGDR